MPMLKLPLRSLLMGGSAALALSGAAFAADRPANPDGAKTVADAVANFVGKSGAASATVTSAGDHYVVSFDLAALNPALAASRVTYDPAMMKLDVYEQDDGAWRVEQKALPAISGHVKQPAQAGGGTADFTVRLDNAHYVIVYDPGLAWPRSAHGGHDKGVVTVKAPGLAETIGLGPLTVDLSTKVGAEGRVATTLDETLSNFDMTVDIDPRAYPNPPANAQPVHVVAKAESGKASVRIDDLQPHPLVDLWTFYIAHPTRAELAANQDRLKTLLSGALADQATAQESLSVNKLAIDTSKGLITMDSASVAVGGENKGAASGFSESFAAQGLAFPAALVPTVFSGFVPSSFDIGFKASGFDLAAAGAEWIADLHLDGSGPPLSKDDRAKVSAKFLGGGPITVTLTPTAHVDASSLKLAMDGGMTIVQNHPTGKITLKMRDFDKTVAALQAFGPEAQQKLTPVIAMAKGLGKTDASGAMSWVGEIGADKVIKVNGLPLGKAPF